MKSIPWVDLKASLLTLPELKTPFVLDKCTIINSHSSFIKTHIAVIDSCLKKENLSVKEKRFKLFIAKPHYDRLLNYYSLRV